MILRVYCLHYTDDGLKYLIVKLTSSTTDRQQTEHIYYIGRLGVGLKSVWPQCECGNGREIYRPCEYAFMPMLHSIRAIVSIS